MKTLSAKLIKIQTLPFIGFLLLFYSHSMYAGNNPDKDAILKPTPAYTIDYISEQTNEIVDSTDLYSYFPDMSDSTKGNGEKLELSPGQDVYFQTLASGDTLASEIQHLVVPDRPATPNYTIDFVNENTAQIINTTIEYSTSATFAGSESGTGTRMAVTPGQDLYFRVKVTASSFASEAFLLDVPARPATPSATIDYTGERTVESFPSTVEYSTLPAFTSPVSCTGTRIALTPGQDIYIRVKASASSFISLVYHLVVPDRPVASLSYTIDYINERTVETVASTIEYSNTELFTVALTGAGTRVTLIPGQDMYFRLKATASTFASDAFLLEVSARPAEPTVSINFSTEATGQTIPSTMEYSTSALFTSPVTGNGTHVTLTPGQDLYFRVKSTASTFSSEVLTLDVPARPATPTASIDYAEETTVQYFSSSVQYSTSPTFSNPVTCTGEKIPLTPGQDLYIWIRFTASSFSSLDYHLVVPDRPSASLSYTIDYISEQTVENVSSNIEYSETETFDDPINGTGNKASLTPGQDMYFRVKATAGTFGSEAFVLDVPPRPATPSVSINYVAELTQESIDTDVEYSTSASFASSTSGTGSPVAVTPGQDLYFRVKSTVSSFVSETFLLDVPTRPATPTATIDFAQETTVESFTEAVQYSTSPSFTNPITCTGNKIPLTPGQDLYLWSNSTSTSFASFDYHLVVPDRPSASISVTVDYVNEQTVENIATNLEYAETDTFNDPISGAGNKITLTPGQNLYFRVKATVSTFASIAFLLDVPQRPSTPTISVNFSTELTGQVITADMEYSTYPTFDVSTTGTGSPISLTPGQDLYFRYKATASSFVSEAFWLFVPQRPATPTATIDYANQTTVESFSSGFQYSTSPTYSNPVTCSGAPIPLTPGLDVYIWENFSAISFASLDYDLVVPYGPVLEYAGDYYVKEPFPIHAVLDPGMTDFDLMDVFVTNGQAENLTEDNTFDIIPEEIGEVHVIIPSNTFGGASFASNEVIVYYDTVFTAIPEIDNNSFSIYPNPSKDGMIYINTTLEMPYSIDVFTTEGSKIRSKIMYENDLQQLDFQDLPHGIYYLKIYANNFVYLQKLILE
jgi:hypothetical protein